MNRIEDLLVPITFFLTTGFVIFKFLLYRHEENIAMIERGITTAPKHAEKPRKRGTVYFMFGMLCFFIGIAFVGGLLLTKYYVIDEAIIPALMLIAAGLALLATYGIAHDQDEQYEAMAKKYMTPEQRTKYAGLAVTENADTKIS